MSNMVQYGMWGSCPNHCAFCLRKDREQLPKERILWEIEQTKKNINIVDWKNKFSDGISLLGGELFHFTDKDILDAFMTLIDDIIEKVLKVSDTSMFSCVTNGLYNPDFLYRVIDRLRSEIDMNRIDIHFSYDLRYRFDSEESRQLVIKNILDFQKRYNHTVVVQMILTQRVINLCREGIWSPNFFETEEIPGTILSFLYPHPIWDGSKTETKTLEDFNFTRADLLWFMSWLKNHNERCYHSFISSTKHSGTYKYTGRFDKDLDGTVELPKLTDGKEELLDCGHSKLYQCYSDSKKCMQCDLENFDEQ